LQQELLLLVLLLLTLFAEIPPGLYLSQNLVRPCPKGRYREGIAGVEEEAGKTELSSMIEVICISNCCSIPARYNHIEC
jgi:hypothetical protein